jgi:hypothetical protein
VKSAHACARTRGSDRHALLWLCVCSCISGYQGRDCGLTASEASARTQLQELVLSHLSTAATTNVRQLGLQRPWVCMMTFILSTVHPADQAARPTTPTTFVTLGNPLMILLVWA